MLPALIAERRRSEHRNEISHYISQRSAPFAQIVERAIGRGELPDTVEPQLLADLFSSPLANSILFRDHPLDDEQWSTVIDIIIAGVHASQHRP